MGQMTDISCVVHGWLTATTKSKTEVEGLGEKTKRDDMEPEGMSALAKENKMNRDAPPGTPV